MTEAIQCILCGNRFPASWPKCRVCGQPSEPPPPAAPRPGRRGPRPADDLGAGAALASLLDLSHHTEGSTRVLEVLFSLLALPYMLFTVAGALLGMRSGEDGGARVVGGLFTGLGLVLPLLVGLGLAGSTATTVMGVAFVGWVARGVVRWLASPV